MINGPKTKKAPKFRSFLFLLMKELLFEFLDLGFLTTQTTEVVNA